MSASETSLGSGAARLAVGGAIIAVASVAYLWVSTANDIRDLRTSQRIMAAELAELRGTTLLDVAGAPSRGADDAVVTIVEFSDYECPFCIKYTREILPAVDEAYVATGKVRYVFRDFPIDQLHPEAIRAHEAAQCGAEQGRFWDLHYRLFSAPGTHTAEQLAARASEAGVNLPNWQSCMESGRTRPGIERSVETAAGLGATGTPTFFIGLRDPATGQIRVVTGIVGAQPFEYFQKALDALLDRIDQSD